MPKVNQARALSLQEVQSLKGRVTPRVLVASQVFRQKAKEGGKKGKLFAVFDEETGAWWYTDADEFYEPE